MEVLPCANFSFFLACFGDFLIRAGAFLWETYYFWQLWAHDHMGFVIAPIIKHN